MAEGYRDHIYIGTVLLEKNRWVKGERRPSLAVSGWTRRIADEGFDGIELWQNHALLADEEEREKLCRSPVPVRIFNSYARCETEAADERRLSLEMARLFSAEGMKFNFGRDPARHGEYVENVKAWRAQFPPAFRFLCEGHGGTTLEDPQQAAETFARMGREDYQVIVHGFGGDEDGLRRRFSLHGDRITHIHVSLPAGGFEAADAVPARVDLLRSLGFRGSFTIEFTEGVGDEGECIETLFRNAARDLKRLRKCLTG